MCGKLGSVKTTKQRSWYKEKNVIWIFKRPFHYWDIPASSKKTIFGHSELRK